MRIRASANRTVCVAAYRSTVGPGSLPRCCVAAGVALSVYTAIQTPGHFHSGVARGFNTFAFFTILSNLIVGATALLLVRRLDRTSTMFRTFRLIGLVAITVTGIVYHVALASVFQLAGVHQFGNQLVHTVVPLLTVIGWVAFGPRGLTSARIAGLSLLFPFCWLGFTLIRGAAIHWYPYPFIEVTRIGYGEAILNSFWVLLLLLGLAAGATALDSRLGRRTPEPAPAEQLTARD
jgi:hypothetical protein